MSENPEMLVLGIVVLLALFGSGIAAAYFVGRKGGESAAQLLRRPLPANHLPELERCLELSAHAMRDAEALSTLLAQQALPADGNLTEAVQRLIDSTKNLSQRVTHVGADDQRRPPNVEGAAITPSIAQPDSSNNGLNSACRTQEDAESASPANLDEKTSESAFEDARRFKRSSFHGCAKATIYPRHPGADREPVRCTVLTRDLCCGGIGIAHSEQLFPKQIIVLDAVGKLLVGEVRWCRREDEDFYIAGCRLVKANA